MTLPIQPSPRRTFSFRPGVDINYEVHGTASRSVLLLHGFGASLESWRDVLPLLDKSATYYLVDLKGHGLSAKPKDSRYSLSDQADIVLGLVDHLRISRPILVGHSYGGGVALMSYFKRQKQPELAHFSQLVLIDSAGYVQSFPFFMDFLRRPLINHIILDFVPKSIRAEYTLNNIFFDRSKVTAARINRYANYFDLPGAHGALIECAKQIIPPDADNFVQQIKTISVPTLILWGENDPVVPLNNAYRFHRDIKDSRLEIVPKCGHVTHEEQPIASAIAINRFLSSVVD